MAMDFLTAAERTLISSDVGDILSDPQLSGTIVYKGYRTKLPVNIGGQAEVRHTIGTFMSFRVPVGSRQIDESGGTYKVGDEHYMVRLSHQGTISKDDMIVDQGIEKYVVAWNTDPLKIFHDVIVRNLSS